MKSTLIDAGPMIALFDKDDKYHNEIKNFLKKYKGNLITTWPVITEVLHMLDFNTKTQLAFLKWVHRGAAEIFETLFDKMERIIELTERYRNVPMDLADASLVVISEELGINEIITIDSDYYIYRTMKKEMLENIFFINFK